MAQFTDNVRVTDNARDPVEQLAEMFLADYRAGRIESVEQFAASHPQWSDQIRDVFPTLLLIETLKPQREGESSAGDDTLALRNIDRLDDFHIAGRLGRGGMGIVYRALQQSLGRPVALKVLTPDLVSSPQQIARFRREAQAAAKLHHTNIVPVFGVGQHQDVHYYVMQLIDGPSLDRLLSQQPAASGLHRNWRRIAELGRQIACALDYAHAQGTLHRDVKPANLLLDQQGILWITDFGLARPVDVDGGANFGQAAGTLRYMSPEQLEGRADARSDIYSLGLTLYEMLTWRPAYVERRRSRLLQDIAAASPTQPSQLDPLIPRDLEDIVSKAIAPRPADRYQTAGQLADDLSRFLEHDRVSVRRPLVPLFARRQRRPTKIAERRRYITALVALVIASITSVFYLQASHLLQQDTILTQRAVSETRKARQQRRRADKDLQVAFAAFDAVAEPPVTQTSGASDRRQQAAQAEPTSEATIVLQRLLAFFHEIIDQNRGSPDSTGQLVHAHRSVGHIHLRLGDLQAAEAAFHRGLTLCQQGPNSSDDAAELVHSRKALLADLAGLRRQISLAATDRGPVASDNP